MSSVIVKVLPILHILSFLLGIGYAKKDSKSVDLVMSLDQYYDAVNSNESYTMVEYTTSWCHHCKKLAPNFVELMHSFEDDATKPPVRFLEVNCEIFGSTICKGFPGFPMIHLVQPRTKPLDLPVEGQPVPLWRKVFNYLTSKYTDPRWQLDSERVIEYKGSRDAKSMKSFIEAARRKDKLLRTLDVVLDDSSECHLESSEEDEQLCEQGKQYLQDTRDFSSDDLAKERLKLENIVQNNKELRENVKLYTDIKLKLQILNQLLLKSNIYDEL